MLESQFYYNKPLDINLRGLKKEDVISLLEVQDQERFGLYMAVQAVAFVAIAVLSYAIISAISHELANAVVLGVTGFILGGGAALSFYKNFFLLSSIQNAISNKYTEGGEIALTDIEKIMSVASDETAKKLVAKMSFEQAVMARNKVNDDEKFSQWVKGADWSAIFAFAPGRIAEYGPIVEKNGWILRAVENDLSPKEKIELAKRNLLHDKTEVFGILEIANKCYNDPNNPISFPIPEIVEKIISNEQVDLNWDSLLELADAADYMNSGQLFRFIDEYVYAHIDQFDQNDLLELVSRHHDLILVRSYLARQLISRPINLNNWEELWNLASKIAQPELRAHFIKFAQSNNFANDISFNKNLLSYKEFKTQVNNGAFSNQAILEAYNKERLDPTEYYQIYYDYIVAKIQPEFRKTFTDAVGISSLKHFKIYRDFPDLKDKIQAFIEKEWKALIQDKQLTILEVIELLPKQSEECIKFMVEEKDALIKSGVLHENQFEMLLSIYSK